MFWLGSKDILYVSVIRIKEESQSERECKTEVWHPRLGQDIYLIRKKVATIASQASAKLLSNAEKYEGDRDGGLHLQKIARQLCIYSNNWRITSTRSLIERQCWIHSSHFPKLGTFKMRNGDDRCDYFYLCLVQNNSKQRKKGPPCGRSIL